MTIDSPIITGSIQSPLNLTGNISASGAITGSGFFTTGNIVANTLIVQVVSSSVDYITGSAKFGTLSSNTFQFTGSVYITGSALYVNTSGSGDILDIQKSQNAITHFYFRNTDSTNASSRAYLNVVGGTNRISLYSLHGDNNYLNMAYGNFYIQMNQSSSTINPFFISASGNVGIGTTTPNGGISGTETALEISNSNVGVLALTSTFASTGKKYQIYSSNDGGLYFRDATTPAQRMCITSAGNVGIGTTSPNYALVISSSASGGNRVQITPTTTYAFFQIDNSAGTTYIGTDNSTAGVFGNGAYAMSIYNSYAGNINFYTSATIRMTISSGSGLINIPQGPIYINKATSIGSGYGLVIGSDNNNFQTMAMFVKADGNNNINFFNAAGTYVSSISTSTTTVTYGTTSDYRLKKDLKDFNGLDLVNNIKCYDFAWKINDIRSYGVIAHELQPIIPDAVNGDKDAMNEDGTIKNQNVDYSKIVPVLIKAIQELKAEIDELKNK